MHIEGKLGYHFSVFTILSPHSFSALSLLGVGVSLPIEVREGTVTEGINYEKKGNRIHLAIIPSIYLSIYHTHTHTKQCVEMS